MADIILRRSLKKPLHIRPIVGEIHLTVSAKHMGIVSVIGNTRESLAGLRQPVGGNGKVASEHSIYCQKL